VGADFVTDGQVNRVTCRVAGMEEAVGKGACGVSKVHQQSWAGQVSQDK
jgi:hypothetical protein